MTWSDIDNDWLRSKGGLRCSQRVRYKGSKAYKQNVVRVQDRVSIVIRGKQSMVIALMRGCESK